MFYKNRNGIVQDLDPNHERTKKWVEEKSMTPLTPEEEDAYFQFNKLGKYAVKRTTAFEPTIDALKAEVLKKYGATEPEEIKKITEWLNVMDINQLKDVNTERNILALKYRYKIGRKPHHTWGIEKLTKELV